jgi:hypothetical protein
VEAHGGSVEVESNGTRRSRFTLRLPVNEGTRVHADARLSAVASGSARE